MNGVIHGPPTLRVFLMTLIAKMSSFLNHRFLWTVVGHSYMNYNVNNGKMKELGNQNYECTLIYE